MNRSLRRRHRYLWVALTLVLATTLILAWRARLRGVGVPLALAPQHDADWAGLGEPDLPSRLEP